MSQTYNSSQCLFFFSVQLPNICSLPCHLTLTLHSPLSSFRWTKDGHHFDPSSDPELKVSESTGSFAFFTLSNTADTLKPYQGKYVCYASNELGTAVSNQAVLTTDGRSILINPKGSTDQKQTCVQTWLFDSFIMQIHSCSVNMCWFVTIGSRFKGIYPHRRKNWCLETNSVTVKSYSVFMSDTYSVSTAVDAFSSHIKGELCVLSLWSAITCSDLQRCVWTEPTERAVKPARGTRWRRLFLFQG